MALSPHGILNQRRQGAHERTSIVFATVLSLFVLTERITHGERWRPH
jgi:hypothetical protein